MNTRLLFNVSATLEAVTGFALIVAPLFVGGLLLGEGLGTTGVAVARILGLGLLSVGIAAWESRGRDAGPCPRAGLCAYNIGVAVLLALLGTTGGMDGSFLWPVAGLHGLIGLAMLRVMSARIRSNNI